MATVDFVFDNTSLEPVKDLMLKANFEETAKALTELVKPYAGMIVTPDMVSNAKSDRAKIRKVESSIEDCRKTVKKAYTQPLEIFESECKKLVAICKTGSTNLDSQIKLYEEEQRREKLDEIRKYFDLIDKKYDPSFYTFERIFDHKWTNATSRIETAQEIMTKYCEAVDTDIDAILAMESPFESYLLNEYKNGKTISQIISMDQQMKRSQEEKRKREEEAEKAKMVREMEQKIAQEATAAVPAEPDVPDLSMLRQTIVPPTEQPQPEIHTVNIWVRGTREQLAKLADLIDEAGLQYGAL